MSETVLITGATGFVGRHTVTQLLEAGYAVRALCRSEDAELLEAGVDVRRGDVLDPESIKAALEGDVALLIHGAGYVSRDRADRAHMMRLHVNGTRVVTEAAVEAGVRRVVHVSTSGVNAVGDDPDLVYHEDDPVPIELINRYPYYLSKWLAERAADDVITRARRAGSEVELVTLNPSLALGPGDKRGSSTEDIQRFLDREIPLVPSGGVSFIDARDIAAMCVAALEKGRHGERYLLGALNLTLEQFFERLSEVSGVAGPWVPVTVPGRWSRLGVGLLEKAAAVVGAKAPVSEIEADMASRFWYVDPRKAEVELGFEPRDPMTTLLDTVRDLRGEA
jgi:dihydroflavonol-4-reductase